MLLSGSGEVGLERIEKNMIKKILIQAIFENHIIVFRVCIGGGGEG